MIKIKPMENYTEYWQLPSLPHFEDPSSKSFITSQYYFALRRRHCSRLMRSVDNAVYNQFIEWTNQIGVKYHSCQFTQLVNIKDGYEYPALIAAQEIPSNYCILEIPYQAIITPEKAYFSELKEFYSANSNMFSISSNKVLLDNVIVVYLLYQISLKEKSHWYSMLQVYSNEAGCIFTWKPTELNEIQDKRTVWGQFNKSYQIDQFYTEFSKAAMNYPQLFPTEVVSKDILYYAWDIYTSRSFLINGNTPIISPLMEIVKHENIDCKCTVNTMEPSGLIVSSSDDDKYYPARDLIDCFKENMPKYDQPDFTHYKVDYSKSEKVSEKKEESNQYAQLMYTKTAKFKKDEQILMPYGKLSNTELMSRCGFCVAYNKYDYVEVSLKDLTVHRKIEMFHRYTSRKYLKEFYPSYIFFRVYYHKISFRLLKFCRLQMHNDIRMESHCLDLCSEVNAIEFVINFLRKILAEYPTTLKEDLEIINGRIKIPRYYYAVLYRLWKKKILHHQIYLLQIAREIVHRLYNDVKWEEAIKWTSVESTCDEFNVKLNRKMLQRYLIKVKKFKKSHLS